MIQESGLIATHLLQDAGVLAPNEVASQEMAVVALRILNRHLVTAEMGAIFDIRRAFGRDSDEL